MRYRRCALVLQDVHLDQYHWKLSKQIIDRAKKNPEAAHRPTNRTNRTNRTRRYITHTRGWKGGRSRERERLHRGEKRERAIEREGNREGGGESGKERPTESERDAGSVLKNKKLPYIFQALTCAWVGWIGRWTGRGLAGVGTAGMALKGVAGRAGSY